MDIKNEEMSNVNEANRSLSEESEDYRLNSDERSEFDGIDDHTTSSLDGTSLESSEAETSKTHNFPSQRSQSSRSRSHRGRPGGRALGYLPASGQYNDKYRELLNEDISEATGMTFGEDFTNLKLETSQLGVSVWTKLQKELFFSTLTRYGKDNLPKLAAITEKSEPEVAHYLYLLDAGVKEMAEVTNHKHSLGHEHIPAARELSDECCQNLQRAADALISLQESWEASEEQKKHGSYWLLDQSTADLIEDEVSRLSFREDVEQEIINQSREELEAQQMTHYPSQKSKHQFILDSIPAARLLRLKTFINLSKTFFMNSPDPEYDWNTYVSSGHGPSIYRTAFDDFHSLTVSITRRIAHAAAFQAMTRSRTMDNRKLNVIPKEHNVRRADVDAALEILGMKTNIKEYWATLPRRQGLRCYRLGSKSKDRQRWVRRWIPVDEVEGYLKGEITKLKRKYPREHVMLKTGDDSGLGSSTIKRNQSDVEIIESEDGEDTEPLRKRQRLENEFLVKEGEEADYIEKIDRQSSMIEERKLWKMLKQTPPPTVSLKDITVGEPPKAMSPEPNSASDWRDWFQYEPEWLRHVHSKDQKAHKS